MTKKKLLSLSVLGTGALLALAGCKGHEHTAGTEWEHDETNHWHLCTGCGEKMDVAAHSFEDHVVAPTDDAQGYTEHVCSCGYTVKDTYVDKEYEITFEGGDYAFALGLAEKSKAGATVSFKVTLESGYEAYSVTASYGEGESATAVALTGSLQEGFTFTMPKAAVTIKAETRGAYFEVAPADEEKAIVTPEYKNATAKTISNFIGGYIVDDKIYTGDTTIYARAGATVHLLRNYVHIADNIVYTIDGVECEPTQYSIIEEVEVDDDGETTTEGETKKTEEVKHTYNTIDFVMPAHSVSVDVTAVEREFQFDVVAPDYVITELYTVDAEGNKTDVTGRKGASGSSSTDTDKIFLDVKLDAEHSNGNYKISNVTVEYETRSGYEDKKGTVVPTSAKAETAGKTYSYSPNTYTAYYGNIKLKVDVLEAKYKDATWVGEYGGTEFYGGSMGSSYSITADAFGQLTMPGYWSDTTYAVLSDDGEGKLGVNSSASAEAPSTYAFYDGDVLILNYYSTRLDNFTDVYCFIRGKKNSEITWSRSTGGRMDDTAAIYVVAKDSDGKELGNFLKAGKDFYFNVTVKNEDGTTEGVNVNANSNFVIYKAGTKVAHYGVVDGEFGKIED